MPKSSRNRLPAERDAVTHKFRVGETEGYVTVGLYDDGQPGELFIRATKQGSTVSGLLDAVSILTSLGIQYGVPLESIVRKLSGIRFEPAGLTSNPQVPTATSIVDYVFRWLGVRFNSGASKLPVPPTWNLSPDITIPPKPSIPVLHGGVCPDCGTTTIFQEGCVRCEGCGWSEC